MVLADDVKLAKSKGIPVVYFNTDHPGTGRDSYVGAKNVAVGRQWASYLVDNEFVRCKGMEGFYLVKFMKASP